MSHENINEVKEFYENGAEINRLERGLGIIEAARTKEILARYIEPGMAVCDVGGCSFAQKTRNLCKQIEKKKGRLRG